MGRAMDRVGQMQVFVRVVERGSFSAAARDLGLTQSGVSKQVQALEQHLGVRLMNRTTRSARVTEAGARYHERCRALLAELEAAEAEVRGRRGTPAGVVTVSAPVPFGLEFVVPRLVEFQRRNPGIHVHMQLTDQAVNLVEEGIDLAIRLGRLAGDGMVARKIGDSPVALVAAADYAARSPLPHAPSDLAAHHCLLYTLSGAAATWRLSKGSQHESVRVSGTFRANNLLALRQALLAGFGVALLPLWMVDSGLRDGRLVELLEGWRADPMEIHAVYPTSRMLPARVRVLLEYLAAEFALIPLFRGPAAVAARARPGGGETRAPRSPAKAGG